DMLDTDTADVAGDTSNQSPTLSTGTERDRVRSRSRVDEPGRTAAEPNARVQFRNESILTSMPLTARPTKPRRSATVAASRRPAASSSPATGRKAWAST